jgi:hypothetical protein
MRRVLPYNTAASNPSRVVRFELAHALQTKDAVTDHSIKVGSIAAFGRSVQLSSCCRIRNLLHSDTANVFGSRPAQKSVRFRE